MDIPRLFICVYIYLAATFLYSLLQTIHYTYTALYKIFRMKQQLF